MNRPKLYAAVESEVSKGAKPGARGPDQALIVAQNELTRLWWRSHVGCDERAVGNRWFHEAQEDSRLYAAVEIPGLENRATWGSRRIVYMRA